MVRPEIESFRRLTEKGNLIPVYREILADTDTPVSAYLQMGERPAFLLESVEGGEKWGRYSFLGLRPSRIYRGFGSKIEVLGPDGGLMERYETEDPIGFLREVMSGYQAVEPEEGLPRFTGGLVGYMGYDMVRFIERLPDEKEAEEGVPDMFFMLTDTMLIFDSLRQTIKVVVNVHLGEGEESVEAAYGRAIERIDDIVEKLRGPGCQDIETMEMPAGGAGALEQRYDLEDFVSSFESPENFEAAVERAREYIHAGDIVQVVLSQRFRRKLEADAFGVYRALRVVNPSPYMWFFDTGGMQLVGSSPEILVRLEGDTITVRPIAGTRRRGRTPEEDLRLEEELRADPKERAEHVMLVDLGRNDVGRVARTGTVKLDTENPQEFMTIERYSHVMHMVSNVEGRLGEGKDAFDVLRACFPAGTVSGAPKVRAMEIIDELEPVRRGPYAGALGYFGYSGNMDTCITIRTLQVKDGWVTVQAGAGVVADSVPALEYKETVNKAMGMMRAVYMAESGSGRGRRALSASDDR